MAKSKKSKSTKEIELNFDLNVDDVVEETPIEEAPVKDAFNKKELEKEGVIFLDNDYLTPDEQKIFTRIKNKPLVRSWNMSIKEFLKIHAGKQIFIYPNGKSLKWEYNNRFFIRGYSVPFEK